MDSITRIISCEDWVNLIRTFLSVLSFCIYFPISVLVYSNAIKILSCLMQHRVQHSCVNNSLLLVLYLVDISRYFSLFSLFLLNVD